MIATTSTTQEQSTQVLCISLPQVQTYCHLFSTQQWAAETENNTPRLWGGPWQCRMNPVGNTDFEINSYWAFLQNKVQRVGCWASATAISTLLQYFRLSVLLMSSAFPQLTFTSRVYSAFFLSSFTSPLLIK